MAAGDTAVGSRWSHLHGVPNEHSIGQKAEAAGLVHNFFIVAGTEIALVYGWAFHPLLSRVWWCEFVVASESKFVNRFVLLSFAITLHTKVVRPFGTAFLPYSRSQARASAGRAGSGLNAGACTAKIPGQWCQPRNQPASHRAATIPIRCRPWQFGTAVSVSVSPRRDVDSTAASDAPRAPRRRCRSRWNPISPVAIY